MSRPVSPLLHDYKPSPSQETKNSKPLHWFALGLGLPLLGLGLILAVNSSSDSVSSSPADHTTASLPGLSATDRISNDEILGTSFDSHLLPDSDHDFHPPLLSPLPAYDSIQLTIKSGDTLDRLFRRHDLDLGHLAAIVKLPKASDHLRRLRPGDEFEIKHEQGQLVSLYRELGLTSALMISKLDEGFAAEIIERPIEIRKRRAYGRIESSLFESGTIAGLSDKVIMNLAGILTTSRLRKA